MRAKAEMCDKSGKCGEMRVLRTRAAVPAGRERDGRDRFGGRFGPDVRQQGIRTLVFLLMCGDTQTEKHGVFFCVFCVFLCVFRARKTHRACHSVTSDRRESRGIVRKTRDGKKGEKGHFLGKVRGVFLLARNRAHVRQHGGRARKE